MPAAEREGRLLDLARTLAAIEPIPDRDAHERSSWDRDPAEAASAVEWFAGAEGPRVVFVGKLIVSKGVDLLLAAWPLVHAQNPGARLMIAGFGAFRETLEDLWRGLTAGDAEAVAEIARRGRGLEGGEDAPLNHLAAFLAARPDGYDDAARDAAGSVGFSGRLEHDEVARLVPSCDSLVFPSTFPEAFGMVAAEAAAGGVLPVSAAHSGALEVSRELAADLPDAAAPLVSFQVGDGSVAEIAANLNDWLALDPDTTCPGAGGAARNGGPAVELGGRRARRDRGVQPLIAVSAGPAAVCTLRACRTRSTTSRRRPKRPYCGARPKTPWAAPARPEERSAAWSAAPPAVGSQAGPAGAWAVPGAALAVAGSGSG